MYKNLIKTSLVFVFSLLLCACSAAKLEARLEANPQCKDVINPKTGTLMPCPGSDKSFYREVGLAPAKTAPATTSTASPAGPPSKVPTPASDVPSKAIPAIADCKPQPHKKTGGILPCPVSD